MIGWKCLRFLSGLMKIKQVFKWPISRVLVSLRNKPVLVMELFAGTNAWEVWTGLDFRAQHLGPWVNSAPAVGGLQGAL